MNIFKLFSFFVVINTMGGSLFLEVPDAVMNWNNHCYFLTYSSKFCFPVGSPICYEDF